MDFDIVTAIFIGIMLGLSLVGLYAWYLWHKIKGQVDRLLAEAFEEAKQSLIGIDVEIDKGVYFCYTSKDKQFVCQGTTVQEIREAFGKRFPDKTAYLAGGDPTAVEQFKAQLLEMNNENSTSI